MQLLRTCETFPLCSIPRMLDTPKQQNYAFSYNLLLGDILQAPETPLSRAFVFDTELCDLRHGRFINIPSFIITVGVKS